MNTAAPYGYCPICGAPGAMRERSPYGNDRCANGHVYKARDSVEPNSGPQPQSAEDAAARTTPFVLLDHIHDDDDLEAYVSLRIAAAISELADQRGESGTVSAVIRTKQDAGGVPYTVDPGVSWRYDSPPRGSKIFLLTRTGVAVEGTWTDDGRYIAWHPLFKRDRQEETKRGIHD